MLTDEQAQELQAANAALTAVLDLWRRWYMEQADEAAQQSIERLRGIFSLTLGALGSSTPHARLALERATVRSLRERVALISDAMACTCKRCQQDRELLAQWAALGLEAT